MRKLLAAVILVECISRSVHATEVVHDHLATATIVLPQNASANEEHAAQILGEYIFRITGCRLPVSNDRHKVKGTEISVGLTQHLPASLRDSVMQLGDNGFLLVARNGKIYLAGGKRRGTVYSVTTLLQDVFGCRKFKNDAEYVPKAATLNVPDLARMEIPKIPVRVVNGPMSSEQSVKDWMRLTTISDDWTDPSDSTWKPYFVHTFTRLLDPAVYFSSHPEYYALINGVRVHYGQPCLSEPAVFDTVLKKLRAEIAAHPSVRYWSVSQNDNYDYCRCPACQRTDSLEGSPSGTLLRFVNRIAAEFPDKTITTLAYQYTRSAPKITKPLPNVMITLCSIELDRSRPIAEHPGSKGFVQDLKDWNAICNNVMIWDYEVQFTNYLCPFPLFYTLKPNLQLFNQYGAKAHFQQCNISSGAEWAELKMYLMSRLLWNTEINVDSVIDDFMSHYYGKAGVFVRRYFDRLHQTEQSTAQSLDIYGTPVSYANTLLSAPLMDMYDKYMDLAEAAVADDPVLRERVKVARLPLLFSRMEIGKTDLFGPRGWFREEGNGFRLKEEMRALPDTFIAICRRNHVTAMHERNFSSEEYYQATLRFINVSVEGDLAFRKEVSCDPLPAPQYSSVGLRTLTNGVHGTENYKMNWLGWEGTDVQVTVDMGKDTLLNEAVISTLQDAKSWILHPNVVQLSLSSDGVRYSDAGSLPGVNDPSKPQLIQEFRFSLTGKKARYLRFSVTGTKTLPLWHTYSGNKSWVFVDEVSAR